MKTIEDTDDTLSKGRTSDNTIIDDYKVIYPCFDCPVGDIINVGSELITTLALGDECTELNILDRHLLGTDTLREDPLKLFIGKLS